MQTQKLRNIFDDDCEFVSSNSILSSTFYLNDDETNQITLVLTQKVLFYHFP